MGRRVAVVPHVHWDREWYRPFQAFRLDLVDLLDEVVARLEADSSYVHFLLDGQMAAVDDYLAVRPEAEARVRRLVTSGRLAVGPWYVLPDQFCVSGETLVRNLQLGLARAEALGGAMPVGYLPDPFGHVAQMPQILRQAGMEQAVVWRGVPRAVDRTAFRWSSPDGSTVRAEYLPVGYANGAFVPEDAERLLARVRAHEAELAPLLRPEDALLWMNGADHQRPQPWLPEVVDEANRLQEEYRLELTSVERYLSSAASAGLPPWTGELRSAARANLLPGVLSNRVDVKQAAAAAERALERRAEPLCALFLPPDRWPEALLGLAWLEVLRNAAHDSVCACSADEVVEAVVCRYAEAGQIADGLAGQAVADLGASMSVTGPVAVNCSGRSRSGLVELVWDGPPPASSQVLASLPAAVVERTLAAGGLGAVVGQVANQAVAEGGAVTGVQVGAGPGGLDVLLRTGPASKATPTVASDLAELYAVAGARREAPVRLRVERAPFCRVLTHVDDVPPFGWKAWAPGTTPSVGPVRAEGGTMANGLITVEVDPEDGTFALDGVAGLDRLVDGGDAGDTYNYSPPEQDALVDRPTAVAVGVVEGGPLRSAVEVRRTYLWPERVAGGGRTGERQVTVTTRLELRAGERLVRIATSFDNVCRDHRLRSWFPLPDPAATARAECAFTVVERGAGAEGGPHERGLPTFPSRRFVSAGGLTLVHDGLLEYELLPGPAPALALTLLRCVGVLSGTDLAYRPMPAGPPLPVEGAQMAGPRTLRYGVVLGPVDPYAVADDAFLPLDVAVGSGQGRRPPVGSDLSVHGAQVSAVRRTGEALEVRVFNPTGEETTVTVAGRSGWLVDLRHRPLAPFDGAFPLRPHGIATALVAIP